jgi:hypothetical protein
VKTYCLLFDRTCAHTYAGGQQCTPNYFCHVGGDALTTMCCPQPTDPCQTPMTAGDGRFTLARWYYDQRTQSCRPFTFRGMRGNTNNFLNRQDCRRACPGMGGCVIECEHVVDVQRLTRAPTANRWPRPTASRFGVTGTTHSVHQPTIAIRAQSTVPTIPLLCAVRLSATVCCCCAHLHVCR